MSDKTLRAFVEGQVRGLEEKTEYLKKHDIIRRFHDIQKQIDTAGKEIESLIKKNKFEEATTLKLSLNNLENQLEIMRPFYNEQVQAPDYEDADLFLIGQELSSAVDVFMDDRIAEQKKLFDRMAVIQEEKDDYAREAEWCKNFLLSKTSDKGKGKLKYKFPHVRESGNIRGLISNFLNPMTR